MELQIALSYPDLKLFCEANQIKKLSVFGSVLRADFSPESDVDILVEFLPAAKVGLLDLARMSRELTEMIGRNVDLLTEGFLSKQFRNQVVEDAQVLYEKTSRK